MTITELTPIGDIAAAIPSSVRVFQRHGIDFCCGGKRALGTVCNERGLSFGATVSAIEASPATTATDRDWTHEPLSSLIDHILATYHDTLREELPRLQEMAARVTQVHGRKAVHLTRMREIVDALSADLVAHMRKEESILFPAIRAIDAGRASDVAWITAPVSAMEHEHDWAGVLLDDLRALTGDYTLPDSACATMRALYQGLEELERAMHVHVHLENNVLFPRALGREAGQAIPLPSIQS
jgi:regulator of cell morphogenesis and NO signaling